MIYHDVTFFHADVCSAVSSLCHMCFISQPGGFPPSMHANGYEKVILYTLLILLHMNNQLFRKLCSTLLCQVSLVGYQEYKYQCALIVRQDICLLYYMQMQFTLLYWALVSFEPAFSLRASTEQLILLELVLGVFMVWFRKKTEPNRTERYLQFVKTEPNH